MTLGRPTEYGPHIVQQAVNYLTECQDKDEIKDTRIKLNVKLPSIEGLAKYLGIHRDTLYAWEKEYDEFSDILESVRVAQAERLINNGLSGDYNPTIAKLLLAKHGYKDATEVSNPGGTDVSKALDVIADLAHAKPQADTGPVPGESEPAGDTAEA